MTSFTLKICHWKDLLIMRMSKNLEKFWLLTLEKSFQLTQVKVDLMIEKLITMEAAMESHASQLNSLSQIFINHSFFWQ